MSDEKKKGIEHDLTALALNGGEPITRFREWDEVKGPQGLMRVAKAETKYHATINDICIEALEGTAEGDSMVDAVKHVNLAKKLRRYGDRPISLKHDNWEIIKKRLEKVKAPAQVLAQFNDILNGAIADEALEDL